MVEIVFVRHGQTVNNKEGVLTGHLPSPLSEQGIADAKLVAKEIKEIDFDLIISSDLVRAKQCCEILQKEYPGLSVEFDPHIRERAFGSHEGKSLLELGYPDASYESMVLHLYECDCPGGETNSQLINRVVTFLRDLSNKYDGKRVLVVTHGGVIMLAINYLLNEEISFDNRRSHKNAYVSYVKIGKDLSVVDSLFNVPPSELKNIL